MKICFRAKWQNGWFLISLPLTERANSTAHRQDALVKIPGRRGEVEAPSWTAEIKKRHIRRVTESPLPQVSMPSHPAVLPWPTVSPGGKGEPRADTQLPQHPGSFPGNPLRYLLMGITGGTARAGGEKQAHRNERLDLGRQISAGSDFSLILDLSQQLCPSADPSRWPV